MTDIILFDGQCVFCDHSVQFILKRDVDEVFQFASLQSDVGQQLLKQYNIDPSLDSIVVIYRDKVYIQSDAAIVIAQQFKGVWKLLVVVKVLPKWLRDKAYALIAKNRYRLFGEMETCRIPTKEERRRFL
jgi:predicted DCC family thiol-disulfide oxidoreductase YuxK